MKRIIVSGRSGSGKSVCLRLLEDIGYYCVDNLPINLLPALEAQMRHKHENLAISIDARNISIDHQRFREILTQLKSPDTPWEVVYIDADDATLIKRFSETRRKHPLTTEQRTLKEALHQEKQLLEPLQDRADLFLDTTNLNTHQLRKILTSRIVERREDKLSILFQSFGYKYGIPLDADYVFDARTLPNPYWHPDLKEYTGRCQPIISFLEDQPQVQQMLQEISRFLNIWIPHFEADNRCYLTVAIGCTGGKHRSVFLSEQLTKIFKKADYQVQVRHRELSRYAQEKKLTSATPPLSTIE